jgi:hypothetical protein
MTPTARTDIHRPSAPEFDPEDYDCQGVFDLHPEEGRQDEHRYRHQVITALKAQGYSFANAPHGNSAQCSHCGAYLRYAALMLHTPTGTLMYVGETCLDNRFDSLTKDEFARLRAAASLNRERRAQRERFAELCERHPVLAYATYAWNIGDAGGDAARANLAPGAQGEGSFSWVTRTGDKIETMHDIATRARQYGTVSDKQVALLERLMGWLDEAEQRRAAREIERTAKVASGVTLPTEGRQVVTGEIVSISVQDNDYGVRIVMTVRDDRGFAVWGTLPRSLDPGHGSLDNLRGKRCTFTAAIEASDRDPLFGFFKRPTKASYLG